MSRTDPLYHGCVEPVGSEELPIAHNIDVTVDRALCVGSGPCFVIAPNAFVLDADMKAIVLDPSIESEKVLVSAAQDCPTQAIYLSRNGDPVYP